MSELSNKYQQIMKELRTNIKDEQEKEFVMSKFQELSMMFMDVIDRLTYLTDLRVKEIEEQQKEIDKRMVKIQKAVDGIESDIYEDDENYEFEIVCPYCNHEFVTDINSDINTEVECPECHNMIELDWNGEEEEECSHHCSDCHYDCVAEDDEDVNYDEMEEKNSNEKKKKQQEENNEDDEDM